MLGDCLEKLKDIPDNSVDSVVTDPPYGLSFMGKKWDYEVPGVEIWREVLRVLKPGGHLLSFAGTRTYHRMAVNIEDAGFEIRDQIMWLYGSGFPKSLNISKALDKMNGCERPRVPGGQGGKNAVLGARKPGEAISGEAISGEAIKWDGWGTSLKPANEPICMARKPLSESTVAKNILKWGVGGINVDGCRIGFQSESDRVKTMVPFGGIDSGNNGRARSGSRDEVFQPSPQGRFPANLLLDEEAAAALDAQSGNLKGPGNKNPSVGTEIFGSKVATRTIPGVNSYAGQEGGASRFFYVAKVSAKERNAGLEGMPDRILALSGGAAAAAARGESYDNGNSSFNKTKVVKNHHPTVKPIKLMEYLCRLVTPPSGVVLDPFMGSGSTGIAAKNLGFQFIGIEREPEYHAIANQRIQSIAPASA